MWIAEKRKKARRGEAVRVKARQQRVQYFWQNIILSTLSFRQKCWITVVTKYSLRNTYKISFAGETALPLDRRKNFPVKLDPECGTHM